MLPLHLTPKAGRPLSVLVVGAHPDDIEIGAGGTLLSLALVHPGMQVRYLLLTGTAARQQEASQAARAFLPDAELSFGLHRLPEGRLPAAWTQVKDTLEELASDCAPDLIFAPWARDAHQDHRTIAEIVPTVFRDRLCWAYEIPKWDGDLGRPSVYFPLTEHTARRKVELLNTHFPSQKSRHWWDDEVFLGLARLRGIECWAPYAEAFHCAKSVIVATASPGHES